MHQPLPPPEAPRPDPRARRAPRYRLTIFDRLGPEAGLLVRCASYGLYVFGLTLFASLLAGGIAKAGPGIVLALIAGGALAGAVVAWVAWRVSHGVGAGFRSFIQPSGASTPYEPQYSLEESLAARGDVAGALAAFERRMADQPGDAEVRMRAAELYAGPGGDPLRAAAILRELRALPGVPPARALYATHRLADLYRGPLGDEGRALVELRRLVETFPGSPAAAHAREAIRRMKETARGAAGDA